MFLTKSNPIAPFPFFPFTVQFFFFLLNQLESNSLSNINILTNIYRSGGGSGNIVSNTPTFSHHA